MDLDGNKKSTIGSNASKVKWIFLCIKISKCYQRYDVVHSIGEIILCYAMFFLGKDAWY